MSSGRRRAGGARILEAMADLREPEPGKTVLYEGTLVVDRDLGAGYRYPVLLEDARSVDER